MKLLLVVLALLASAPAWAKKFEHLALTPPMGWNSWNNLKCNVGETSIREAADALITSGMRDAGYRYVIIGDCWQGRRDADGRISADPERFPSGIKAVADYVHSKGLKLGLTSGAGWRTCAGYPGSRGYEFLDAATYAGWGVDYLRYDWCNTEGLAAEGAYLTMREGLYSTGRPVVLSVSEWGDHQPWEWGREVGHLWRTAGDIHNCWNCEHDHGTWSSWGVLRILDMQKGLRQYAGPGHWNDPDLLEVGNGMSEAEDRSHFSMWAMLAAPLMASNDVRNMSDATRRILTNSAVIAIDQDPLGVQGFLHKSVGDVEMWFRPLSEGGWAMTLLNRGDSPSRQRIDFRSLKFTDELSRRSFNGLEQRYALTNIWTGEQGSTDRLLIATIPPHDVLMLQLVPQADPSPSNP